MNQRERFIRCMRFQKVDRIPNMEFGVWPDAITRWHGEGLPKWVTEINTLTDFFRMDRSFRHTWMDINDVVYPVPVETIVEDGGSWEIVKNDIGLHAKRTKTMRAVPQHIRYPIVDVNDYNEIRKRLDPNDPGRYGPEYENDLFGRTYRGEVRSVTLSGLCGFIRDNMGLENYWLAIYNEPELLIKIMDDRVAMAKSVFNKAFSLKGIDFIQIWEDMAYKVGPMVPPKFMDEHMVPRYQEIVSAFKKGGAEIVMMNCDGNLDFIIPVIQKSNIDGVYPCEIAAGSDPVKLRKMFPGVALMGGIDKRVVAFEGKEGVRKELRRLQPVINDGGYIPYIDHFIPPDISFDTFCYYMELKAELLQNPTMQI